MKRIVFALALPLLLAACAGFFPSVTTYEPTTAGDPANPKQYKTDVDLCRKTAAAPKKTVSAGAVVGGAIEGASSNASETLIPPVGAVPGLGAAGGAAGAVFTGIDPMDKRRIGIFIKCLDKLTERDRSAVVVDTGN